MAAHYANWSVTELKEELVRRSAVTTGRKIQLIERLEAYDRNYDFRGPVVEIPASNALPWPSAGGFSTLLPEDKVNMPKINIEKTEAYLLYRMAEDREISNDIKSLEKGRDLVEGGRVLACSMMINGDNVYFSGIVGAAMKNKVVYIYKLNINKNGEPVCSHCECPSGKGPHSTCKHISAVLLMLKDFSENGILKIEKSCTESLQKFHKPKKSYKGM